jgi:hypothetical protein
MAGDFSAAFQSVPKWLAPLHRSEVAGTLFLGTLFWAPFRGGWRLFSAMEFLHNFHQTLCFQLLELVLAISRWLAPAEVSRAQEPLRGGRSEVAGAFWLTPFGRVIADAPSRT